MTLYYSLHSHGETRHKTLWIPTFCPMGVLDVLCLDDEHPISLSFIQMMCCVPKGRAIVLSEFYCATTSSEVEGKNFWGLTLLDSERLVAELGYKIVPPLADQVYLF